MIKSIYSKPVFPASLLVDGRLCVVVGGGKVAERKAKSLIESGAAVTVVSPTITDELQALAAAGSIKHIAREFAADDVTSASLAFAATNEKYINRQVLQHCRERHVLCCCVDGNWTAGDFVTPATLRREDLTVSVSTGGRSCRMSRLIKENLGRHIEMVRSADLMVIGTSHDYLAVEQREPFHQVGKRLNETGAMLMQVWGIHEFMLLNTCNRIEFIAVVARQDGMEGLIKHVFGFDHLKSDGYYVKRHMDAFSHMAVLTAGLLSQTPGENHIVAQIKDAIDHARTAGWSGPMLEEWVSAALHVSKDIRHVTAPHLKQLEIEDLCMDYLDAECPNISSKRIMIIGAGIVGHGLVEQFLKRYPAVSCEWCYHITRPEIPPDWQGRVALCTLNDLRNRLGAVDVIVSATTSSGHVLHQGHAPFFDQERSVLIVDLAMPRNVAPELDGLSPELKVVDLDDLKFWFRREAIDMARIFELSKQIVGEHQDLYDKVIHSFQGGNPAE